MKDIRITTQLFIAVIAYIFTDKFAIYNGIL